MFPCCPVPPDSKKIELASSNEEDFPSVGKNTRVVLVPPSHMELYPYSYFPVVWIFLRSLGVICFDRLGLNDGHKNYFMDWYLMNAQLTFLSFFTYFNSMTYGHIIKSM